MKDEFISRYLKKIQVKFEQKQAPYKAMVDAAKLLEQAYESLGSDRIEDALIDAKKALTLCTPLSVLKHSDVVSSAKMVVAQARTCVNKCEGKMPKRSFDRLPDDVLILILQRLPFGDKMRAELVCKRWNRLVKKYGWATFRLLHPPQYMQKQNYMTRWVPLLNRCGRSVQEVHLSQFPLYFPPLHTKLLPSLVNLRHLDMGQESVNEQLIRNVGRAVPNLKSLAFYFDSDDAFDVEDLYRAIFSTCTKLELLSIDGEMEWDEMVAMEFEFGLLPRSLKCLNVNWRVPFPSLLHQAALQGIQIESLSIRGDGHFTVQQDAIFPTEGLKYLSVMLHASIWPGVMTSLSNALALDLHFGYDMERQDILGVMEVLKQKCASLQYLGIEFYKEQQYYDVFNGLAEHLSELRSVSVVARFEDHELSSLFGDEIHRANPVKDFLISVFLHRKLEHMHAELVDLPMSELIAAIKAYNFDCSIIPNAQENASLVREQFRVGCLTGGKPCFFE